MAESFLGIVTLTLILFLATGVVGYILWGE